MPKKIIIVAGQSAYAVEKYTGISDLGGYRIGVAATHVVMRYNQDASIMDARTNNFGHTSRAIDHLDRAGIYTHCSVVFWMPQNSAIDMPITRPLPITLVDAGKLTDFEACEKAIFVRAMLGLDVSALEKRLRKNM